MTLAELYCHVKTPCPDMGQTHATRRTQPSNRPRVLTKLPLSCSLVFDVLRFGYRPVDGAVCVSIRSLARDCRLSPAQVRRALRKLEGCNLLRGHRTQGQVGIVELRWQSFPQRTVSPTPRIRARYLVPKEEKKLCFAKTESVSHLPTPSPNAHRWAMARLREELSPNAYPTLTASDRERLLESAGAQIWRGLQSGRVTVGRSLALAVDELRRSFADRWQMGTPQELHRQAAGCVASALQMFETEQREAVEMLAQFDELERQRREAAANPLGPWLNAAGFSSLREMIEAETEARDGGSYGAREGFSNYPRIFESCIAKVASVLRGDRNAQQRTAPKAAGNALLPRVWDDPLRSDEGSCTPSRDGETDRESAAERCRAAAATGPEGFGKLSPKGSSQVAH